VDNSKLAERFALTAPCPHCKKRHPLDLGKVFDLGFVRCPASGHSYLAMINGLTLPGPLGHEGGRLANQT
jgi:hypothetical protein